MQVHRSLFLGSLFIIQNFSLRTALPIVPVNSTSKEEK